MAFSVVMPALEMAQETGKLVAWRKAEGESVTKGEPLLEIETDKAVLEVESPADGVLAGVKAQAGDVVPVGNIIAWIVRPGEAPPSEVVLSSAPLVDEAERTRAAAPVIARSARGASPQISPKARRLAKEHGVDIASLRGSGAGGEILATDVLAAAESKNFSSSSAPGTSIQGCRNAELDRTADGGAHYAELDHGSSFLCSAGDRCGRAQRGTRADGIGDPADTRIKLTHTDLLVALVAGVLLKHPRINASWKDGVIHLNRDINIGMAMAVDDGVVATVIHNADHTDLGEIAVQRRDLTERARASRLRPSDIAGATFTISNLGMYQVDAFSAIINSPQAAILAVGSITDRVVPIGGRAAIRPMMTLTLSCDHRVVDGARAAVFLNEVAESVREPEKWLR